MPTRRGSQDRRRQRAEQPAPKAAKPALSVPTARAEGTEGPPSGKAPRRNALFPVGVNVYPLDAETQGWDDWYARDMAAEIAGAAGEKDLHRTRPCRAQKASAPAAGTVRLSLPRPAGASARVGTTA